MVSRVQNISLSLTQGFFSLFLISIPFNVFLLFYDKVAFQTGVFSPQLAGFATLADVFLLISIVFFGIYLIASHRYHALHFGDKKILIILGLFILTTLIIGLFAPHPGLILKDILRFIQAVIVYIMILNIPSPLLRWIKIILISGLIQAVIAIFQFILQRDIGLSILGEPFLALSDTLTSVFQWQGGEIIQSVGTMTDPFALAGFLIIAIFSGVLYYSQVHAHKGEEYINKATPYIFFILLLALFFTFSQGAWIAIIIGGIILFSYIDISWLKKKILLLGIFFITFASVFLTSLFQTDVFKRYLELCELGGKILFNYPFGIGSSHFALFVQEKKSVVLSPSEIVPVPNSFVMFTIEGGIIALILAIILWFTIFQKLSLRKKGERKAIYFSLFVALFILWNLGGGFYSSHVLMILFWIMIALLDFDLHGVKK
jgi:hypothetical protein